MDIKRRLTIYVIYSKGGIEKYIGVALSELKKFSYKLIVICNFPQILYGEENINKFADEVILRENIGYDAGAYKDIFQDLYKRGEIYDFDDVLLVNDSWYGPFWSLENMFNTMDSRKDVDFWSMTKHPEGDIDGIKFLEHCQSFFINFNKRVINSIVFKKFWEQLAYPKSMNNAIIDFEIGINERLTNCGFRGLSYLDVMAPDRVYNRNESPYLYDTFFLVSEARIPIIKWKALLFGSPFIEAMRTLEYVRDNTEYDVSLIEDSIVKKNEENCRYDWDKLARFVDQFDEIYLYGAGKWGNYMSAYFKYKGWKIAGFVQSERGLNAFALDEISISKKTGFIVTVKDREAGAAIKNNVLKRANAEQIFLPNYE